MAPSLLIGHSLGGAAVLRARAGIPSVQAVATIGAPVDPAHVAHLFSDQIEDIRDKGQADVVLAGRTFQIGAEFVEDICQAALDDAIASLKAALLVLHAPRDETVDIENASRIFRAAKHPKSFVTLDTADHLISCKEDAEYVADVIATWAGRYVDLSPPAPEGIIRVSEADPSGFLQDVVSGPNHRTVADEPAAYGGTDMACRPMASSLQGWRHARR